MAYNLKRELFMDNTIYSSRNHIPMALGVLHIEVAESYAQIGTQSHVFRFLSVIKNDALGKRIGKDSKVSPVQIRTEVRSL